MSLSEALAPPVVFTYSVHGREKLPVVALTAPGSSTLMSVAVTFARPDARRRPPLLPRLLSSATFSALAMPCAKDVRARQPSSVARLKSAGERPDMTVAKLTNGSEDRDGGLHASMLHGTTCERGSDGARSASCWVQMARAAASGADDTTPHVWPWMPPPHEAEQPAVSFTQPNWQAAEARAPLGSAETDPVVEGVAVRVPDSDTVGELLGEAVALRVAVDDEERVAEGEADAEAVADVDTENDGEDEEPAAETVALRDSVREPVRESVDEADGAALRVSVREPVAVAEDVSDALRDGAADDAEGEAVADRDAGAVPVVVELGVALTVELDDAELVLLSDDEAESEHDTTTGAGMGMYEMTPSATSGDV